MSEPYACVECGMNARTDYLNNEQMITRRLCFDCNFWTNYMHNKHGIRVDGVHYMVDSEQPSERSRRGFGGARFHFRKHDGTEVVSTNVWHQGTIPKHFRERMPDNAVILRTRATEVK